MFNGIYTPSVTLIDQRGKIDLEAMGAHLDNLVAAGINGILLFGSIGEFFSFSWDEKFELLDFAVQRVAGRSQVLFGAGSTVLDEVIHGCERATDAGADGVVLISPYYFGPSEPAAERFYTQVAEATTIPIMLYNFPDRTGSDLGPELVARLAQRHANIVAIKDTVDCISHTRKVIAATRTATPDFAVLSGFDEYYIGNRVAGGAGVLSGLTNVIPEVFVAMHAAYERGDHTAALAASAIISDLMPVYDVGDLFVSAVKQCVALRGLDCNPALRAPYVPLAPAEVERLGGLVDLAVSRVR